MIARLFLTSLFSGLSASFAYAIGLTVVGVAAAALTPASERDIGLFAAIAGFVAAPVFIAGTFIVGPAAWIGVRKRKSNTPKVAAILGAAASAVGALVVMAMLGPTAWPMMLPVPIGGAVGGLTFQTLMADDAKPRPAPPS